MTITSRDNPALRRLRRYRRQRGDLAILEGPDLIGEAIAAGVEMESVLATPDFLAGAEARHLQALLGRPPRAVAAALLDEIADADSPRGVVALARMPRPSVADLPVAPGVYLFLDGVQQPANLGAIARVAEAAGARALALGPGSAHPNHPRALRASTGSLLRLPAAPSAEPADLARRLAPLGHRWIALEPRGAGTLWETDLPANAVLALGAEGPGLSAGVADLADLRLAVPMAPPVESLNVAVAAALVLFELRRRATAPVAPPGDHSRDG